MVISLILLFQLIFRKVADVKKEKELAEKRKNDPPLELSSDHPVRKLISRFRKISDAKSMQANTDPEKGSRADMSGGERGGTEKSRSFARLINVTENSTPKTGGGSSKWGKMVNGSGPPDGESKQNKPNNENKEEMKNGDPPKPQLKPASKWGKMMGKTAELIKDTDKEETQNNLRKSESMDSGIIRSNVKLDLITEENVGHAVTVRNENNNNLTSRDNSISAMSIAERHMLTSLNDIKLEMKEDMDILHQKMNRIDEQISEILRMFSPSSSPCSSHEDSTYPHSKENSTRNTDNNNSTDPATESSEEESPKNHVLICDVDFIPKSAESPTPNLPKDGDISTTLSNSASCGVSPISRLSTPSSHSSAQRNHIKQPTSNSVSKASLKESKEVQQSGSSNDDTASKPNPQTHDGHLQPPITNAVSKQEKTGRIKSSDITIHKTSTSSNERDSRHEARDGNNTPTNKRNGAKTNVHAKGGNGASMADHEEHIPSLSIGVHKKTSQKNGTPPPSKVDNHSNVEGNTPPPPQSYRGDNASPSPGADGSKSTSPTNGGNKTKSKDGQLATSKRNEYPLISALGPAVGYSVNPTGISSTPRPNSPKLSTSHASTPTGPAASVSDVSMTEASGQRNVISMADDVLKMKTRTRRGSNGQKPKYSSNIQSSSKTSMEGKTSPDPQRLEAQKIPGGIKLPLDSEGAHIKDRDLDIL